MKLKKHMDDNYAKFKVHNEEGIGPKIIEHAEKWAEAMEQHPWPMTGKEIYEIGQNTADWENDIEYDYTVQVITWYWINGKEFGKILDKYEKEMAKPQPISDEIFNED